MSGTTAIVSRFVNGANQETLHLKNSVWATGSELIIFFSNTQYRTTDIEFGEILLYDSPLTSRQRNFVNAYLGKKWNVMKYPWEKDPTNNWTSNVENDP
jgi:hypothetical protein